MQNLITSHPTEKHSQQAPAISLRNSGHHGMVIKTSEITISKTTINALHHQFQTYGKNAREWTRKCMMLLLDIERERVWEQKGFGSIQEYAGKLAGMSHECVNDALRILRITEKMPAIRAVIEKRGINAVKPIVTLLTQDNQAFWAEKVKTMSQHTLEAYRRELEMQNNPKGAFPSSSSQTASEKFSLIESQKLDIFGLRAASETMILSDKQAIEISELRENDQQEKQDRPVQKTMPVSDAQKSASSEKPFKKIIPMDLNSQVAAQLEKLKGQGDWNTLMQELLELREHILKAKKPAPIKARSRHIPAEIEKFIIERSRGICEFSICAKPYSIIHHTQRFALEKIHDPARMVALCTIHERLAHLGLIENEDQDPKYWRAQEDACKGLENSLQRAKYEIDQIVQVYRRPK